MRLLVPIKIMGSSLFGVGNRRSRWELEIKFSGEQVDDCLEIADGSISSRLCFGGLNQTVDALDETVGDPAVEPAQDAVPVALDGVGGLDDRRQAAMRGPEVPTLEECLAVLGCGLLIEFLERQPDLVGASGLEITQRQAVQYGALPIGQVRWIAQPDIACAGEQFVNLSLGSPLLIDRLVDDLDGMELVKGNCGFGQA